MQKPDLDPAHLYEFDGLGTHWWCESLDGQFTPDITTAIDETVRQFVGRYSRFDEHSLLSQLNRDGHLHSPPHEMIRMLHFARDMFQTSGGVFNISVGGALNRLGYGNVARGAAVSSTFWDETVLEATRISIPAGISLDFGGFGKGWLVDALSDLLASRGIHQSIVNGGGDMMISSATPVELALEHPLDSARQIGTNRESTAHWRQALLSNGRGLAAVMHSIISLTRCGRVPHSLILSPRS